MWPSLGKSTNSTHQLKSTFCPYKKDTFMHYISRNTNCLTIDGQVCFYRRLCTDAVKPWGCISWSWGMLIGLHGVPNCSSRQFRPPLWIVSVHVTFWRHMQHCSLSPNWCFTPPSAPHLPTPPPIDSICDITWAKKTIWKTSSIQVASRISDEIIAT